MTVVLSLHFHAVPKSGTPPVPAEPYSSLSSLQTTSSRSSRRSLLTFHKALPLLLQPVPGSCVFDCHNLPCPKQLGRSRAARSTPQSLLGGGARAIGPGAYWADLGGPPPHHTLQIHHHTTLHHAHAILPLSSAFTKIPCQRRFCLLHPPPTSSFILYPFRIPRPRVGHGISASGADILPSASGA